VVRVSALQAGPRVATPVSPIGPRARLAALGLLLALSLLPVQWVFVHSFGLHYLGVVPGTILAVGCVPVAIRRWYWGSVRSFAVSVAFFCSILALFGWYWEASGVGPLRVLGQVSVALLLFRLLAAATADPGQYLREITILRLAAPLALFAYWLTFLRSMSRAGISLMTYVNGIGSGDPTMIEYEVFRSAFNQGSAVTRADPGFLSANLRHEIMAALILAAMVTLWSLVVCRASGAVRRLCMVSSGLIVVTVMLSLSRAIVLGLVLSSVVLFVSRAAMRGALPRRLWLFAGATLMGVYFVAFTPYADLIHERFLTQTSSYAVRSTSTREVVDQVASSPTAFLLGGEQRIGRASSHNMVLDAWSVAGVVGGVAAIAVLLVLVRRWLVVARRFVVSRRTDRLLFLTLVAGALPLVRVFTAGGGLLHLVQWMLVAFFLAVSAGLAKRKNAVHEVKAFVPADGALPEAYNEA
jgi:hypothetical protein